MSNRGAVITWSIANAAAIALMRKNLKVIGDIDLDSSYWAQSLFRRIGFSRRRKTSADSSYWAQSLFRRIGFSRRRKTSAKLIYQNPLEIERFSHDL